MPAHLGYDKQRLAEEAANPVLLVSESDRPGTAPTKCVASCCECLRWLRWLRWLGVVVVIFPYHTVSGVVWCGGCACLWRRDEQSWSEEGRRE